MTRPAVLERPIVRAQIKAYIVQGKGDAEIAGLVNLSRQAVYNWRKRLESETAPLIASREDAIVAVAQENWIADKTARLAVMRQLVDLSMAEVNEHGVVVVERVTETEGEGPTAVVRVTETRDYRASLVREVRGILSDAADELGQKPKPGADGVGKTRTFSLSMGVRAGESVAHLQVTDANG